MFGNPSDPDTKNFRFGALEPTEGLDAVREQLWLAHRYRNKLVEIELKRRETVKTTMARLAPEVAALERDEEAAVKERDAILAEIKAANARERGRTATVEQRSALREAKRMLSDIRKRLKLARHATISSPTVREAIAEVERVTLCELKSARAASGVFWGTYLSVEQSMHRCRSGRPPRFQRWTGDGKLSVQIQHGIAWAEVVAGTDTRLRMMPTSDDRYWQLWFRIGSQGRGPVWAVIPVQLHRDIPGAALVKWCHLLARKIGTKTRWYIIFVLAGAQDSRPVADSGEVRVQLAEYLDIRGMTVAEFHGDDGMSGVLTLCPRDAHRWAKTSDLQEIRDKHFNAARTSLAQWLAVSPGVPSWLRDATQTIASWRSKARLAVIAIQWREQRFAGDAKAFVALEEWRKKDKHLYEWESNQRRKATAWRDDLYRRFACALAAKYKDVSIECADLVRKTRKPDADSERGDVAPKMRWYGRVAALGRLREILLERFHASGAVGELVQQALE